ncbi:LutC/YkgG family protein [Halostreptopolyspora alba]|uniref:Lactate utilization protein C n=1 Tax=Halostreptopolyspora alba TaxID=2487137 RepID=A0A3N0ED82_9ACTN|nr:lactate utilization protein C [Nocardiopsaceae bacterium YIM 96095]
MTGSRERILGRVRAALADVPRDERPDDVAVPRDYASAHTGDPIPTLVDRLEDYKAIVHRVATGELAEAIAETARRRSLARIVVPPDLPTEWTAATSASVVRDDGLAVDQLDAMDGVVTGCAVAVAETGTIVLDTGAAQGRRAISLIPDVHLCVVRADQVVNGVPEAVAQLDPHQPLTWISGPSATSDIELDRVEGVHGPRILEVLLTGE